MYGADLRDIRCMPQPILEIWRWVRILIEYDHADIHARQEGGWTPLHWASTGHNFKDGSVLRFLLEHGADMNVRGQDGWTPVIQGLVLWGAGDYAPPARTRC